MIYDCFTFFNELDLLEIRLNVLNDVVDKFVIVEATKTHNKEEKPLFYELNKQRYGKFSDKIIHIIVDEYPEFKTAWTYENHQRDQIVRGLINCNDNDVLLISDIDEIPNPEIILKYKDTMGVKVLEQKMLYYFLNYLNYTNPTWSHGTRLLSYGEFCNPDIDIPESEYFNGKKGTPTYFRNYSGRIIKDGGWHFSYLGGIDAIINKIKAFSHQEFNNEYYLNKDRIEKIIQSGKDIFDRDEYNYTAVKISNEFPKYIINNQEKYEHLIAKGGKLSINEFFRRQDFKKRLGRLLSIIIPIKSWRKRLRNI